MMYRASEQEILEAREAGLRALDSLEEAQAALGSARGWGIFDMLGGGMISTLVKHAKLDEAQACLEQAESDLRVFRDELADIRLPEVQIDGLLTFADFFLDGFLADLLVQRRIHEARNRISQLIRRVEDILRRLP